MKCSRTRPLPEREKHHAERVAQRERTEHGVAYHCVCLCGEEWIIGVAVSPNIANALVLA